MRLPALSNLISPTFSDRVQTVRNQITETSEEAVTGRRADLTKHLRGQIGKAMLSEKAVQDIARQKTALDLRASRLETTQQVLGRMQTLTEGQSARFQSALGFGDETGQKLAANDAASALSEIFSALNTRHGERYLFAGDATATVPFAAPDQLIADIGQLAATATNTGDFQASVSDYFNDPAGPWQQGIYAGGQQTVDSDGVLAIDPAITEIISGLAILANSDPDGPLAVIDPDGDARRAGAVTLATGQTSLTQLRAERGVVQERILRSTDQLEIEETTLTQTFNDLTGRDQYEAATELQELERSLEASYLLTSRLSNLSLLNFLR